MPFLKDKRKLISNSQKLDNLTKKKGLHHAVFNIFGDKYIGDWADNTKTGKGLCLTRTNRLYEGDWSENFRHGFGLLACGQENKVFILCYRGDWVKGKESGFGERHYSDGGFYMGFWKNGKRHGYGQMWYANGAFYDGDWKKDLRHGLGMWVRPDGNRYEGEWAYDLKHGKGRFFHLDSGQMQEGVWQNDVCVYSFIVDILFRQTAVQPTSYPIDIVELENIKELLEEQEHKMLQNQSISCLKLLASSICLSKDTIKTDTNCL